MKLEQLAYRPGVFGNPLDLATQPSLPKPISHIEIIETSGQLRLEDRKLFNVILALSWDGLGGSADPAVPFKAKAASLRRAIGQLSQKDNRRLKDSLDRLLTTRVSFLRILGDGSQGEAATTLISYRGVSNDTVEWNFDPQLKPYLREPGAWARLHLDVCARFRSKYSIILYEMLTSKVRLNHPVWDVSIADFRRLMGLTNKMDGFGQLDRRVLRPALEEIEEHSRLSPVCKRITARSSRAVERLRFEVYERAGSS